MSVDVIMKWNKKRVNCRRWWYEHLKRNYKRNGNRELLLCNRPSYFIHESKKIPDWPQIPSTCLWSPPSSLCLTFVFQSCYFPAVYKIITLNVDLETSRRQQSMQYLPFANSQLIYFSYARPKESITIELDMYKCPQNTSVNCGRQARIQTILWNNIKISGDSALQKNLLFQSWGSQKSKQSTKNII